MAGSAGGPLGALLMIAPLAAIPVFAIVGVPQFASVVASPADDEEIDDLNDPSSPSAPAGSTSPPRRGAAADDIFSPVPDSPTRAEAPAMKSLQDPPGAGKNRSRGKTLTLPPPDALDQWEIRASAVEATPRGNPRKPSSPAPRPAAGSGESIDPPELSIDDPVDGRVSAEEFSPDLLTTDRPSSTKPEKRPSRGNPSDAGFPAKSGWSEATRRLQELGIRRYRLESQTEEQTFVFTCSFAAAGNPRVVRRFEAEADDPLDAVQRAIEEIEEWRRQGGRVSSDGPRADADE